MENPEKQRYYLLFIEQDLFGSWCLVRAFGSTVTKRGRTMVQICENEQIANDELVNVEVAKRKRGYDYANMIHEPHFYLRPLSILEAEQLASLVNPVKIPKVQAVSRKIRVHPNQLALF